MENFRPLFSSRSESFNQINDATISSECILNLKRQSRQQIIVNLGNFLWNRSLRPAFKKPESGELRSRFWTQAFCMTGRHYSLSELYGNHVSIKKWRKYKCYFMAEICTEFQTENHHRPVQKHQLHQRSITVQNLKTNSITAPSPWHSTPSTPVSPWIQLRVHPVS